MRLELHDVTRDTVREICSLRVRDSQIGCVAPNALSIAQAHFEPSAVFRGVYRDARPIGFVQWREGRTPGTAFLWRFMIDEAHQTAGHGSAALALALRQMRFGGFKTVETSVVLGPESPLGFYLKQGFAEVGQTTPRGEWVLRRPLRLV